MSFIRIKHYLHSEHLFRLEDIARISDPDPAIKFTGIHSVIYFKDKSVFGSSESFASLSARIDALGPTQS